MAHSGELVKMENGRWARFQQCQVCEAGESDDEVLSLLVAVELAEPYQDLLDDAEHSLESFRQKGIPVQVRVEPDESGKLSLSFEHQALGSR